ncbi:MAG: hypothetical protein AB7I79_00210 [Rhizobiaceae bacterium]
MKTNHRRGFVAPGHRSKGGARFEKRGVVSNAAPVTMAAFDFSNGNRGMAKSVRGAKKFVNSRFRFHENAATRRLIVEVD